MNPPLDVPPVRAPEPLLPLPGLRVVAPDTVRDLRGRQIAELRYPATAALVFAGVPGAGKSTALHRFFGATADAETPPSGPAGELVLDSEHSRNRWRRWLGWLPYLVWRPMVHIAHYAGIRAALRDTAGPVVIHDCATFGWSRRMIARWAVEHNRELQVVLIDVPVAVALAGQLERGRRINRLAFRLHCLRWRRLIHRVDAGQAPQPDPASLVILDRPTMDRIQKVDFAA